jgi:1-deoxy-D-xylulose-5-phosphate reductoisomerase
MKKKIAILGSTGSIGECLLKIVDKDKKKFDIVLLTANKNYKKLFYQTQKFNVRNVIIKDFVSYKKFKKINKIKNLNIYNDFNNLNKIFKKKIDYTMSSITGIDGLEPTFNIIKFTKTIAIANKESIICAWNLIKKQLNKYKTKFIPVDSEHFSIWYALKDINIDEISKIYLTASGGPLLNISKKKIKNVKIKEVLKHPNWRMGKKITVDSSTMMNKVFEIIEAKNIFNVDLKKLSILIHPKSYLHALIVFNNGMIKLIAHDTTMEIPIFNSLYVNKANFFKKTNLNIENLNNLNLSQVDINKFNSIKLLKLIPKKISLFETVLVSANDHLVRSYLKKQINYQNLIDKLNKILNLKEFINLKKISPNKITDIINLDEYVRFKIKSKSV